jgi:hypothetical protein
MMEKSIRMEGSFWGPLSSQVLGVDFMRRVLGARPCLCNSPAVWVCRWYSNHTTPNINKIMIGKEILHHLTSTLIFQDRSHFSVLQMRNKSTERKLLAWGQSTSDLASISPHTCRISLLYTFPKATLPFTVDLSPHCANELNHWGSLESQLNLRFYYKRIGNPAVIHSHLHGC